MVSVVALPQPALGCGGLPNGSLPGSPTGASLLTFPELTSVVSPLVTSDSSGALEEGAGAVVEAAVVGVGVTPPDGPVTPGAAPLGPDGPTGGGAPVGPTGPGGRLVPTGPGFGADDVGLTSVVWLPVGSAGAAGPSSLDAHATQLKPMAPKTTPSVNVLIFFAFLPGDHSSRPRNAAREQTSGARRTQTYRGAHACNAVPSGFRHTGVRFRRVSSPTALGETHCSASYPVLDESFKTNGAPFRYAPRIVTTLDVQATSDQPRLSREVPARGR